MKAKEREIRRKKPVAKSHPNQTPDEFVEKGSEGMKVALRTGNT